MMPVALKFDIAINKKWPGEKLPIDDPRWGDYTASFHKEQHSIESLIQRVTVDGCAFAPVMKGGYRKADNFVSAQHIGLDDDRGTTESSIEALAEDPFITDHAAFIYASPSSTPEDPKSRVVFVLDQPFTDPEAYRVAAQAMVWKFHSTDPHGSDPARLFYGGVNADHINLGNVLYPDTLQEEVIEPYLESLGNAGNGHKPAEPIGETVPEGSRNHTMASIVGTMWQRGMHPDAITAAAHVQNEQTFDPPLPATEVDGVIASITRKPPGVMPVVQHDDTDTRVMRFLTAAEIAAITPEHVVFIARPWVAKGSLTEVDGKIKAAGKTTWMMALCGKVLDGQDFMGEPTIKSPIVYVSEQPMTSLREALRRANLLERDDFHLLLYQDTIGTPWPEIVNAAISKCQDVGAQLMVIDTLPQFAGIRGESESI